MSPETRVCQNCKSQFTIEPEDFAFYEKIDVPPPTFCPECRLIRRLAWRNERSLYHRTCDNCKKKIISMYDPSRPGTVYCYDCWHSDAWDPMSFGMEYDFNKPFFEQFKTLFERVPLLALSNYNSVNSEYANFVDQNKNCYLVFGSGLDENVAYASKAIECKDSIDLLACNKSELLYECVNCVESSRLRFSKDCKSCTDSWFLDSCRNCSNCFGCTNLIGKSYSIFNEQYSKEEYQKKIDEMGLQRRSSIASLRGRFHKEVYLPSIRRYANVIGSVHCTGDNINNSKNCKESFDIYHDCEDSKFMFSALNTKDQYDGVGQYKNYFSYEVVDSDEGDHNLGTLTVYHSNNAAYSFNCHNVSYVFGCIGLRKKSYCILNKQYPKEEYLSLAAKIREQMEAMPFIDAQEKKYKYGEFFPVSLAPSAYNETLAQEYFPVSESVAIEKGYAWKAPEKKSYSDALAAAALPDSIEGVDTPFLEKIITCGHNGECNEQCTGAFKIIAQELQFYRRMNLPLPQFCHNCRHYQRLRMRNPLHLWERACECAGAASEKNAFRNTISHFHGESHCPNKFETSYAPDRPEIVYCEQCYQAEVV